MKIKNIKIKFTNKRKINLQIINDNVQYCARCNRKEKKNE